MPPRKKAADATTPKPATRTTRASTAANAAASATTATATKAPVSKAKASQKSKRGRAQSDDEDLPSPKKTKDDTTKDEDEDEADEEDEPAVDQQPKKMVTVLKRGAAPVDPVSGLVHTHQVYSNEEDVWDAMLNQTDVKSNKNKFYVLQLLHPIGNPQNCTLFTHWGRVGENGAVQVKGPWSPAMAINAFKKQYKAKTGTDWDERQGVAAKPGKYVWLERAYGDEDTADDNGNDNGKKKAEDFVIPDSSLELEIQALCNLIFSSTLIDAHLSSMNYDAEKLPLGKLAKSTILNGFAALKELAEVIEKPNGDKAAEYGSNRNACETLSGAYYSIIPHVFGRNRPTVIDNMALLKKELELVDALGDMEIAQELISSSTPTDDSGKPLNPLDAHFRSLGLSTMDPVKSGTNEFNTLQAYVRDTHGVTHRHYQVAVLNAFRVERQQETDAWVGGGFDTLADGERLLLWHGSRTTNFAGILKQGLRIAPPEAPVTGYMFGKGVYFADMMSKSANYCHAYLSNNTGLLLLCEVAAKPFFEQKDANYIADEQCKANKKLSTLGLGQIQPTRWKDAGQALDNPALKGCHMPDGPGATVGRPGVFLQYNEYIVYDASQIRVRYLLMVQMQ